jgi:hypothetical protein
MPGNPRGLFQRSPPGTAKKVSSTDGLRLTNAFVRLKNAKLRHSIVALIEQIASHYAERP